MFNTDAFDFSDAAAFDEEIPTQKIVVDGNTCPCGESVFVDGFCSYQCKKAAEEDVAYSRAKEEI